MHGGASTSERTAPGYPVTSVVSARAIMTSTRAGITSIDHRKKSTRDFATTTKTIHPPRSSSRAISELLVATVIAEILLSMNYRVLVVSCADKHAHIVAELTIDLKHFNRVIGRAKAKSSAAIRERLPGRVWGRDDKHDMLRTRSYQHNAYLYVRNKQGPRAAVWCFDGLKREASKD